MTEYVIGIDFGTSTCKMAWYDQRAREAHVIRNAEDEELTRSIVYIGEQGVEIGKNAALRLLSEPYSDRLVVGIKREMLINDTLVAAGGNKYSTVTIASWILGKLKKDAEAWLSRQTGKAVEVSGAVVTYPVMYDLNERDKIKEAASGAGFRSVEMLSEPEAVAWAWVKEQPPGDHQHNQDNLLIYDLGGGTFDLAALNYVKRNKRMRLNGKQGVKELGGNIFDDLLYKYCNDLAEQMPSLKRPIGKGEERDRAFLNTCRECKEALTRAQQYTFRHPLEPLKVGEAEKVFHYTMDLSIFNDLIRDKVKETVRYTRDFLKERIEDGQRVRTLILAGGASRVPLVEQLLKEELEGPFGITVQTDFERVLDAAKGAAYYYRFRLEQPIQSAPSLISADVREAYQEMAEIAWSDETLQPHEMGLLAEKSKGLGLNDEQAAEIERGVMGGKDRKAIFQAQGFYRDTVEMAWGKGRLSQESVKLLERDAAKHGISQRAAEWIESEVMGADKYTILRDGPKPPAGQ